MEPALEIRMVWENLALALALWTGTKKGLIITDHFRAGKAVVPTDDGKLVEVFNRLNLTSNRELARCVSNQVRGAVTFSAIQTDNVMKRVFSTPPLQEPDPDLRAARSIICLLSNSLSQSMLAPVWDCPRDYRQRFEVEAVSFVMDASGTDGKPVHWEDFGGLEKYLDLLEYCIERVAQAQDEPVRPEEDIVLAYPDQSGQIPMPEIGDGPLSAFLEAKYVLESEAYTIAKDLYSRYLSWFQDAGQEPLVQRSFGLQLTKLGFVRKRRGRGRHWWMGLQPKSTGVR